MNTNTTSTIESTTVNATAVETKPETKKAVTKKSGAKKPSTKKTAKVETKKEEKKVALTIHDVENIYKELGLKFNPDIKGNYRPMRAKGERGGSSLNLYRNGVAIFSTEDDAKLVQDANIEGVTVSNDNNSDKSRAWSVKFNDFSLLKTVLAVYAKNPLNCVSE